MAFLLPSILAGLLGTTIPVLIHLLHRRRAQRVRWGAMRFLGPLPTSSTRRSNWKFWLLMACRIGAIGSMALALSRPQARTTLVPSALLSPRPANVAIVIDHSIASARVVEGRSIFDRCVDTADEILERLRPDDTGAVIFAGHSPQSLNAVPVRGSDPVGVANLRRALHGPTFPEADASIATAIAAARKSLEGAPPGENVVLVLSGSDGASWHPHDDAEWASAKREGRTYALSFAAPADFSDAAVSQLRIDPPILGPSQPFHIDCSVSNLGTRDTRAGAARLYVDEVETDSRPVPSLSPKAAFELEFAIPQGISRTGSHRLRIVLNGHDAVGTDDQALATVTIREPIPILIVDGSFSSAGETQSSQFLAAALHPGDPSILRPTIIPLGELPNARLGDFAAILFNDCPSLPLSARDELIGYVRTGRGIWFIAGPSTAEAYFGSELNNSGLFPCRVTAPHTLAPPGVTAVVKDPSHPLLAFIMETGSDPLAGSFVRTWLPVQPTDSATRILIATPTGDALVMERPMGSSGGAILLWTTSADGSWNNWNLMPNFVPLVIESALRLAIPATARRPPSLLPGEPIEFSAPLDRPFPQAVLTGPAGARVSKTPSPIDGRLLATFPGVFVPGFYTLSTGQSTEYVAVNPDLRSFAPSPLSPNDLRWLAATRRVEQVSPDQLPGLLRPHARTIELTVPLAILAIALLIAESFLARSITRNATAPAAAAEKREVVHA